MNKDYEATGNCYTIGHVVQFTGLTDRTIRSYISMGILKGEKINGLWHFTPEQVEDFVRHPAVRPSIQAKNNAIVYDFLMDDRKREREICMIYDLPGDDAKKTAEFFSRDIPKAELHDFRFRFDSVGGVPRVILKGRVSEVMEMIARYEEWMGRKN